MPFAGQDWRNAKAAYRFCSNPRVNEEAILAGHFQATASRFSMTQGPLLILHDTTEFSFKRETPEAIGVLGKNRTGTDWRGRPKWSTICGILMHASLAVTLAGLPLGLAAIVRTWADRLAGQSRRTVAREMEAVRIKGRHRIDLRDSKGEVSTALLEIKYSRMRIHPPIAKQSRYPDLEVTVIHACERDAPANRQNIDWKLMTDLPLTSTKQAIEKLQWYALHQTAC
jgi:hypothetical protein